MQSASQPALKASLFLPALEIHGIARTRLPEEEAERQELGAQ